MKPSILSAYEKGRRIINTMNAKTISASNRYIHLFGIMFVYGENVNQKDSESARFYREDLRYRFEIKLDELFKKQMEE